MFADWSFLTPALPEIFLAVMAMVVLMVGVFSGPDKAEGRAMRLALVSFILTYFVMLATKADGTVTAFPRGESASMFVSDTFAYFTKALVLFAAAIATLLSADYLGRLKMHRFEYYVLLMLAVVGMMLMASANDLITLYVGLELMSFCLYILGAFWRDNLKSTEAGLKYFVLGSLSSGLLLYGISLFYGLSGDTSFNGVATALDILTLSPLSHAQNFTVAVALVMVITGLAFKISAVPFHMWTPDVYEGSPTPVTAFMAAAPKVAAVALLVRVLVQPLEALSAQWMPILAVLAVVTMAVGALLAIVQDNLKRLIAYSSIAHVGFILVGIVAAPAAGAAAVQAVLLYLAAYVVMTLGIFAVLLTLRQKDVFVETLDDLSGLHHAAPGAAFALLLLMFSLAGIPPLAGFFAKFAVFSAAVEAGHTWLAVFAVLCSVVGAYYCLRVVKTMYFNPPKNGYDRTRPAGVQALGVGLTVIVVLFSLLMDPLGRMAEAAAQSLF